MKLKTFFIPFKGFSMEKITQIFLEGESPTLKDYIEREQVFFLSQYLTVAINPETLAI